MTDDNHLNSSQPGTRGKNAVRRRWRRRLMISAVWAAVVVVAMIAAVGWLAGRAATIKSELEAAAQIVPALKDELASNNKTKAIESVNQLRSHTAEAREAAEDPLWKVAAALPFIGANFSAVSEVARSADDVSTLAVTPIVNVFETLNWDSLIPGAEGTDLEPLKKAYPSVASAAHAVRASSERLEQIGTDALLPQVSESLLKARNELEVVTGALDTAEAASQLAPDMLGASGPRNYLLMIQNNAESRASGGIPGALAVVTLENGKLSLGQQSSATALGAFNPRIPVEPSQEAIYSTRLGKYMQDVNLTPDFPTAAKTALSMWTQSGGTPIHGVISLDPMALSYILKSTGPVKVGSADRGEVSVPGLPEEIDANNAVETLLSDVYAKIPEPKDQDAYFAGVAQEIFSAVSSEKIEPRELIAGLVRGADEGRISLWSASAQEQEIIAHYPISGSVSGASIAPAQFGVYFNDGTGAKMDYYVKRSVQLFKECTQDGYEQTTVRVTSTNTAPADAATSLPSYVTGAGKFGVPPGSVQTNIAAYGPVQANVETVKVDGVKTEFAPYIHSGRPVGVLAVRLAPGESRSVDFTFGKIVQHTEPNVVVTPTVQDVKDVILPTQNAQCG